MASRALIAEERIGLIVALAAHAALVALIVWRPPGAPAIPPPERVTVTISDETAPTSTSPEPMAEPAPPAAPETGEPPEPAPQALPPPPTPAPVPRAEPPPRPIAGPRPAPRAAPSPPPQPKAAPRPAPTPAARPSSRPGASRIGSNFLPPNPSAQATGAARNPPAAAIGPAVRGALIGAISRAVKPHWQGKVPQGVDAEKLVTVLAWELNADGSLAATPRVVRQDGLTDANRPQAPRHAELAIRSVQLAAPFDLPAEYYSAWRRVTEFRFDKRLSQ